MNRSNESNLVEVSQVELSRAEKGTVGTGTPAGDICPVHRFEHESSEGESYVVETNRVESNRIEKGGYGTGTPFTSTCPVYRFETLNRSSDSNQ